MTKRKRYSAEFKAKVALEAIREDLTTAELAKKYDIHPTMITGWKRTAIENMASVFDGNNAAEPAISAGEIEKLHAKIGQLVVERDFLSAESVLNFVYPSRSMRFWILKRRSARRTLWRTDCGLQTIP